MGLSLGLLSLSLLVSAQFHTCPSASGTPSIVTPRVSLCPFLAPSHAPWSSFTSGHLSHSLSQTCLISLLVLSLSLPSPPPPFPTPGALGDPLPSSPPASPPPSLSLSLSSKDSFPLSLLLFGRSLLCTLAGWGASRSQEVVRSFPTSGPWVPHLRTEGKRGWRQMGTETEGRDRKTVPPTHPLTAGAFPEKSPHTARYTKLHPQLSPFDSFGVFQIAGRMHAREPPTLNT